MNDSSRVPFLIGVTGHMDLRVEELPRRKRELRLLFRFLKLGCDATDPDISRNTLVDSLVAEFPSSAAGKSASHSDYRAALRNWRGLQDTPIVVLSSLAPGADSLVVETALEAEFRDLGFSVRAPLPFPHDMYRDASTFVRGNPVSDEDQRRQADYDDLISRIEPEQTLPVVLAEDLSLADASLRTRFSDDRIIRERRRLRYRAAGEFVAGHASLLIAIWDPRHDSNRAEGTAAIVEARRSGLTPGLLASTRSLAMADRGPLVHLYTHSAKSSGESQADQGGTIRILHPHDLAADDSRDNDCDARWQKKGIGLFCRIDENLNTFNKSPEPSDKRIKDEVCQRLTYRDARGDTHCLAGLLAEGSPAEYTALRRMAAIRRSAANVTRKLRGRMRWMLGCLFVCSLFAAALLHVFAHWHPQSHGHTNEPHPQQEPIAADSQDDTPHPDPGQHAAAGDSTELLRSVLGSVALVSALCGLVLYWHEHPKGDAERAHDYRALAEGLRVQFYWNLAGLGESVPANYMQRQRSELDWIRGAIRGAVFPSEPWRNWFSALDHRKQLKIFRCVLTAWVFDQRDYFQSAYHRHHQRLHFWHKLGGVFALAGVWTTACLVACKWSAHEQSWLSEHPWQTVLISLLLIAVGIGLGRWRKHDDDEETHPAGWRARWLDACVPTRHPHDQTPVTTSTRKLQMILNFLMYLPVSLALALLLLAGSGILAGMHQELPDAFNLTIVLGGWCLLAGALSVAWAEKNLDSELAYQYNTMYHLYYVAQRKIERELATLETQLDDDVAFAATRRRMQNLILELGKEALDENAEWLLLHRARPLEPVMAG